MASVQVSEIMTRQPRVVSPGSSLLEVKHIFEDMNFHHHLPVCDGDQVVGIISLYDFIIAIRGASLDNNDPVYTSLKAQDIMNREVKTCSSSDHITEIARIFSENRIHALPVVQDGKLAGIVTTTDLLKFLSKL